MPQIEHNAPRFKYVIFYKLDEPGEEFNLVDVDDWKQNSYTITGQQTFRRYLIKVEAHNELGESNVQPRVITGFSGEDSEYIYEFLLALSKTLLRLRWIFVPRFKIPIQAAYSLLKHILIYNLVENHFSRLIGAKINCQEIFPYA
jgi:hypothetical protein